MQVSPTNLERVRNVEIPTFWLEARRSASELHPHNQLLLPGLSGTLSGGRWCPQLPERQTTPFHLMSTYWMLKDLSRDGSNHHS